MSIISSPNRDEKYVQIPVALLRDKRLSYGARGLAIRLLSDEEGIYATAAVIAKETLREGSQMVLSALRELEQLGYVKVEPRRYVDECPKAGRPKRGEKGNGGEL